MSLPFEQLKNADAIAVFDSGVGGLTVASRLHKILPHEKIIYFGDTARVPYGGKTKNAITRFSFEIVDFLMEKDIKAVVIACNTISTTCLDELVRYCRAPVFGIVEPGISAVLDCENLKKVGIIGTTRTIDSQCHAIKLKEKNPDLEIFTKACPLFAPLVEEGFLSGDITRLTIDYYLKELLDNGIEALLLACTHYPLLSGAIRDYIGDVKIIEPAEKTAELIKEYLLANDCQSSDNSTKTPTFYLSEVSPKFGFLTQKTFGCEYGAEIVNVGGLIM